MEDADLARYFETIQQSLERLETTVTQFRADVHERFERTEARLGGLEARLDRLEARLDRLQAEMHERFEFVDDRLRELARVQEQFSTALAEIVAAIARLDVRIEKLQAQNRTTNTHLLDLRQEMQQRFRVVNERLAELAA